MSNSGFRLAHFNSLFSIDDLNTKDESIPDEANMTRKFLYCFPLRLGNIVFGYIIITIAIAVFGYNLYELGLTLVSENYEDEKFRNFENLENIFGKNKTSLVAGITIAYYISYCAVSFLLFVFGTVLVCGAYHANLCLVTTFFVYSFMHLFFTIGLIAWEAVCEGWIQLGLIALADFLLIICLFSVKYLMEAIRTGNIYSRPGEILCEPNFRSTGSKHYYHDFDR
ncbi:uncharacterized protein LOC131854959 isoform X1 [Achroia grisella]|uniref:uncharacterized protein LOC131854959 isoform X1 n=2 Tax=Achroia grisella TaxID=688607 RepID=UPI0027D22732|nr:uncharacterized protein LOC131854959 isoform X1 [Achroia grisella]